ncbi:MAG: MG2 domain-containing protein [FCB group bacterium]|jgi:uncharacterized protein YfaS (alpha-2-macroglobulin family)|nr:MG2 domain-containing protein [FCB group bacterium]
MPAGLFHSISKRLVVRAIAALSILTALFVADASRAGAQDAAPPPAAESPLRIVGTVPLEGEAWRDRIVFFFDREIEVAPGADGQVKPFAIDPAIEGEYRIGPNFVAFRAKKFDNSQIFNVTLSDAVRSKTGAPVDPAQRNFTFANYEFAPFHVKTIETKGNATSLGIVYPAPVDVESLRTRVSVKDNDGADVPAQVEASTDPNIGKLTIQNVKSWPVQVIVADGVASSAGAIHQFGSRTFKYPEDTTLSVTDTRWGDFRPESQEVVLRFSSPVTASGLQQFLSIRSTDSGEDFPYTLQAPPEEPQVEHTARLNMTTGGPVKLEIAVAEGLTGAEQRTLAQPYMAHLQRQDEPLRIDNTWWGQEGRTGLALHFELSNTVELQNFKEHLRVTPELPGLALEREYGNNYALKGQWDSKQNYELTLLPGLKFGDTGELKSEVKRVVTSEAVPSFIGFGHEGKFYFPRQGGLSLPLESRNVAKAKLSLYKLFPSNLVVALRDMGDQEQGSQAISWSRPTETKDLTLNVRTDRLVDTALDLNALFPDKKGVYVLQASEVKDTTAPSEDYYWSPGPQAKLVLITQMGLLAHWRNNELVLFAHDLYSLAPLPGTKVSIYSDKNQLLGEGNTDAQGMLHLKNFDAGLGVPKVAVAELGDDYTFLELDARPDDSKSIDPNLPAYSREGYDAFIYADRDLYRPGETAHLAWTVRTNYGDALKNVPLMLTVVKPNGRNLLSRPVTLSSFGTGAFDLQTQRVFPTGSYQVRLSVPGNDAAIGTYSFHLEDFVPNRMKVAVTAPEGIWAPGQEYAIQLNAQHLFGAPASDRKADARVVFQREPLVFENWKEFSFDNDSDFAPEPVTLGEARTDEEGNAAFTFSYSPPEEVTFPTKAVVVGRVMELGGRSVTGRDSRIILPSPVALGLATAAPQTGEGVDVFAAAVNPDGTPANLASVKVTLERETWDYYVRRYYSHYEPNWSRRFETIETREVPLTNGRGQTAFEFNDYGYYRVRVHSDASKQFASTTFYGYGGRYQTVDSARPSLVKLTLDKPKYNVGEEAVARIESPFDGQGIVVVQGEEIQRMIPVKIEGGKAEVRLPIGEAQYPNVWLEVTIIHTVKTERTQMYPFSSFGMVRLDVENPRRKLAVNIVDLPNEVRPAQPLTVTVDVKDPQGKPAAAEVTIAAVDEGIHAITEYKNPAPFEWLGRARRPDFRRAHYYDKVVYDFAKTSPGGDLDSEMGKRASAVEDNWIKPLALWSGIVRTDANGRATVTFDVPEFSGQLRIVAVANGEKALGATAADLLVRRPYMLQASMPRFVLPNDRATCGATVFNNSDAPATAVVSWSVGGALSEGQGSQTVDLPAHKEAHVLAPIVAGNAIGQGELRWGVVVTDASGKELERLDQRALLPVRPPAAYQSANEVLVLAAGESREFRNEKFVDDARAEIELALSASPTMRLKDALQWLVGYPYGCVEQTTSRMMPTYLLRKHEGFAGGGVTEVQQLHGFIEAGISRLFSMQTPTGGMGFWPGDRAPYPYGSIYALHFLTLVKNDREFEVPADSFKWLQDYVRELAMDWNSGNSQSDLYQRAYATYVLALDGDMDAVRQIERFDSVTLPRSARYLLAAALAKNTKDTDRVKLYLESAKSEPFLAKEQAGTLNSPIRNTAVELLALKQMNGDPKAMLQLSKELVDFLTTHRHGNTQETAFIVSALADYMSGLQEDIAGAGATVVRDGKEFKIQGPGSFWSKKEGQGAAFTVTNTGTAPMFVSLTTRGVPATPSTEPVSEGMSVMRTLLTNDGQKRAEGAVTQGTSYVVEVEVICKGELSNVIVADLLPAGLEIENPRLDPEALSGERFSEAVTPTYLDVRDDRMVAAFDTLAQGTHRFYYVVRAVTPGQFQHPPIAAECMYDASFRALSAPDMLEVASAQ